jgi:hypothetical protein
MAGSPDRLGLTLWQFEQARRPAPVYWQAQVLPLTHGLLAIRSVLADDLATASLQAAARTRRRRRLAGAVPAHVRAVRAPRPPAGTQTVLSQNSGNVWDDTGAAIPAPLRHD